MKKHSGFFLFKTAVVGAMLMTFVLAGSQPVIAKDKFRNGGRAEAMN